MHKHPKHSHQPNTLSSSEERIAKRLSRAGVSSRREAEKLILDGRISVQKSTSKTIEKIEHPAFLVTDKDKVFLDGKLVARKEAARLWLYHKPVGLVTSHNDPQGRPTVFNNLPKALPRVISIGRLDINSEGLLLLTNDGELSRLLESPKTALSRIYRVRVYGALDLEKLESLKQGCKVEGVQYGPILVDVISSAGRNSWLKVKLTEGKNREIRNVMRSLGLQVNRLSRISYGEFKLEELERGKVLEVEANQLNKLISNLKGKNA